ncbi:hypothetical protein EVAR_70017_1 [Eumeta japonica]|uniref:Uncharacterized protein n=1 Tax=Eumeta variegata TaxID=151549 RepID=A0A4C2ACS5_EUMVA|nr:hypothetical protein EVAR_70017_1 [Eumeta japonica]
MSHRTRERPAECLASLSHSTMIGLPRAALELVHSLQMYCKLLGAPLAANGAGSYSFNVIPSARPRRCVIRTSCGVSQLLNSGVAAAAGAAPSARAAGRRYRRGPFSWRRRARLGPKFWTRL